MTSTRFTLARAALACCLTAFAASPAVAADPVAAKADPKAAQFEALAQAVTQNPAAAGEQQIVELVTAARDLGRPYAANIAIKTWLARTPSPSPAAMLAAAENAASSGDLKTAASRYKLYLAAAPADENRSRAAARLYALLIDDLGNADDAYTFMARQGADLRQSPEARKFDFWFLDQAIARRDAVQASARLAAIMAEQLPLELERITCWDRLDALMGELARATPNHFAAAADARKIVGLVRESPARAARYGLIVAWLEFRAGAAGKDPAALTKSFEPVVAAATAYVDAAPTAATLADVMNIFVCPENNHNHWNTLGDPTRGWWTASFAKLPDDEKPKAINWQAWWGFQASPDQWIELGTKFPEVFKKAPATAGLPFLVNKPDPAVYAAQATFLTGVASDGAKTANALAATKGTDLLAGLRHLSQQESWHSTFESTYNAAANSVWPIWKSFPRQPAATDADWYKAFFTWAPEAIIRSPIAIFQPAAAQSYLNAVFAQASADPTDKSAVVAALRSLDWVPWDEKTRREVIAPTHTAFKQWADQVRTQLKTAQAAAKAAADDKAKADEAAKWEKAAATIAPVEEEFKKAFDVNVSASADLAKLADPLAGHLARCVRAIGEKKLDAYLASAREAYKLIRDYPEQKTPFGQPALTWLLTNRPAAFDTIDFQREVIADQMAQWKPNSPTAAFLAIDTSLFGGRPGWNWNSIPKKDRDQALAFNKTIGEGILAQLARNAFSNSFFERFRTTRRGNGWQEQEIGNEVLAKLIETKAFQTHKSRVAAHASATCDYQWLIRSEFQGLAKQFPVETFFDDMFVEESKAAGWLDWAFTQYSRDEKKKGANVAAERFAASSSMATGPGNPFGYDQLPQVLVAGDRRDVYTSRIPWEVWQWSERALAADQPLRDKVVQTAEAAWGTTRFDSWAMGRASIPGDPAIMQDAAKRADFFQKLAAYLERGKASRGRSGPPYLGAITQIPANGFSPEELKLLLSIFDGNTPVTWTGGWNYEHLGLVLAQALPAQKLPGDLARIAPELWRIGRDTRNGDYLSRLAGSAAAVAKAGQPDLAAAVADAGLEVIGTDLPEAARTQLTVLRTDAILALGGTNPVPRNDPRWPIYDAQLAFAAGKLQTAWDRYASNPAIVAQMYKELNPAFTTWLIRENTQTGNYDRARELAQLMLAWVDATPGAIDAEAQAGLLVAYADIALGRRDYPQARALYERIAAAKEFDGTVGKRDAELRVAEVDRLARQFDSAKERLDRLARRPDRILQSEANYQLALLKADQEETEEAAGYLEKVFTLVPNHVGGRILEGKLNLLRRKYDVASKVKLGVLGDKKFLIPGKALEVDLEDKNLAVVGKASQIEIKAWTTSGDEERFNLFPFGDSKTRFTGQIPTQLGAAVKGDHTLQVVGGDTVRYTFAESFGGSKGGLADEPAAMTVVTDSDLFVSSGDILTKEELENRALEKLIRDKLKLNEGLDKQMALSAARSDDQIKPGNRINVRVVDPDRGTSAAKDTLQVRAATASGDSLLVTLTETDAYSGIFEGGVPTGTSQATAFATDSTDGNDPNNTISPGSTTPWIALADNKRPKAFSVDLNDNVALGPMTVTANVPGRKLKDVYVQTSLNGRDFRTVGQWRADGKATFKPWDGTPRVDIARFVAQPKPLSTPAEFEDYLARCRFAPAALVSQPLKKLAIGPWDGNLGGMAAPASVGDWYVGHWYAGFEVDKNQTRTFTLDPKGKTEKQNIRYVFAIDGVVSPQRDAPLTISRALTKGVHRIDVYAHAYMHAGINFEVLIDSAEPPFTAPIPEAFFSPVEHPAIAETLAVPPATIEAAEDNAKLTIGFAKDARARVVRLVIADYETDAPAINAITLADATGKKVLPTQQNFQDLAKNDILEIIPGDRITVAYDDAAVITPAKKTQERFLTATYTNAEVSAAFVDFKEVGGERRAEYIPMRRFKPGDTVKVFVNDPDMDGTDKPDRISLTVRAGRGEPVSVEALETEDHSGIFLGTVFPVAGKPSRSSEITVAAGDDLKIAYIDRENTDPGIPWERTSLVEQTGSDGPELRVYDVASRPLDEKERADAVAKQAGGRRLEERIAITREIVAVRPEAVAKSGEKAKVLVAGPLLVEVLAPRLAQSPKSVAELFVQTESGREKLGRPVADGEFPLDVPGTIRLRRHPGDPTQLATPPGTSQVVVRGNRYATDALGEGRFTFLVEKELGPVPETSQADIEYDIVYDKPPILQIRGNDTVYIGCRTADAGGQERWTIQPVELTSDIVFDVMDRRYQEEIAGTHVGDSLNLRIIHPALDTSDEKDAVSVKLTASGGGELELPLTETFGHSGVFKGAVKLAYREAAGEKAAGDKPTGDGRTLPVAYGETVTIRYTPASDEPFEKTVAIFKGGDAELVPFTKQFKEPEIAVQTQFTVAEAWFELAKRHRELGQESLARREIAQGKKLLEEAIRDYPNTESRAQADYLLANLSFEFSKDSANEEIARQHAIDAVTRFSDIVSSYPDSEYAPKSQYKKALVLEKLGQIDQACEEYVKLSYRYPDNELVAETIARLGQYFLAKGKEFDDAASGKTDAVEKEKVAIKGREMFTTAAQVFGRLGERFPQHALAAKTKMLSAQCYLRAKDFSRSLDVFESIYKDTKTDKDLAAEAMYWAGDVCLQKGDMKNAYRAFKKLTWDYPESKWAKFARGRLTEEAMVAAEAAMEKDGK